MRCALGNYKMNKFSYPRTRILTVCIEALVRFSHVYSPDGLSNTLLSQGSVLETAPAMEW